MSAIGAFTASTRIRLLPHWRPALLWAEVARHTQAWLVQESLAPRDAVLLLPFAGLLEPARAAFVALGGWQPRIETALTMAASLGPPPLREPGACCGDAVLDRINANRLLRGQPWGQAWAQRDAAGFDDAAQALRAAAATRAPGDRAAFWATAQREITALPATMEALLLGVALPWAQAGAASATDGVFAHRPSAWIVLRLAGADDLCDALLGHAGVP
jgi:ATP-dependent helicase/nuclease subunit B